MFRWLRVMAGCVRKHLLKGTLSGWRLTSWRKIWKISELFRQAPHSKFGSDVMAQITRKHEQSGDRDSPAKIYHGVFIVGPREIFVPAILFWSLALRLWKCRLALAAPEQLFPNRYLVLFPHTDTCLPIRVAVSARVSITWFIKRRPWDADPRLRQLAFGGKVWRATATGRTTLVSVGINSNISSTVHSLGDAPRSRLLDDNARLGEH